MINQILVYIGAGLTVLWGFVHLFPTKNIVDGLGDISEDNRNIIQMEWIVEAVALIFMGVLLATITAVDATSPVTRSVYWLVVIGLNALSLVSLFTGFKVNFIAFKLCPVIFTGSSILVWLGIILQSNCFFR